MPSPARTTSTSRSATAQTRPAPGPSTACRCRTTARSGTPDHHCPLRNDGSGHGPCIGDYPHIGADANGFYITTNEYAFFPGNIFHAAQIYAFSKQALAAGAAEARGARSSTPSGRAQRPAGLHGVAGPSPQGSAVARRNGGTEFFLSSDAAEEANGVPAARPATASWSGRSTNTSSLDTANPTSTSTARSCPSAGTRCRRSPTRSRVDLPLGNASTTPTETPVGDGCWRAVHRTRRTTRSLSHARLERHPHAAGLVRQRQALRRARHRRHDRRRRAWPASTGSSSTRPRTPYRRKQGYLALAGNNVTYPAIATTATGSGVMAFTLVGEDDFPSAAYAAIDATGVGPIHIAAAGLGPQDGFTGYKASSATRPDPLGRLRRRRLRRHRSGSPASTSARPARWASS